MSDDKIEMLDDAAFAEQEKKSFRIKVGVTLFIIFIGIGAIVLASLMRAIVTAPQ